MFFGATFQFSLKFSLKLYRWSDNEMRLGDTQNVTVL